MAVRHWTVMWVPHGAGPSRTLRVSIRTVKALGSTAVVTGLLALAGAYFVVRRGVDISRLERLEKANQVLAQEVVRTRNLLRQVSDTIAAISRRDQLVRLLAGLPPNDPDVLQAGIGGPAGPTTPKQELLASIPLGREALGMSLDIEALIRRANLLARSFQQAADNMAANRDRLLRTPSISPTRGWWTSMFAQARMHPIFHQARRHDGIDIAAPLGTPIVAPAGGVVIGVTTEDGYGKLVTIDHGYGVVTRYAHCSKILVRVGQRVRRGDQIALVGNTGLSTSPHLHYEVEVNGKTVDPRKYIFPETIVD